MLFKKISFIINMVFYRSQASFANHNSVWRHLQSHNQYCYYDLLLIYNLHRETTQDGLN